jgi:hypothetical protein
MLSKIRTSFIVQELLYLRHDIESTKDKLLDAVPEREMRKTFWQSIETLLDPYRKLSDKKKTNHIQTVLVHFHK